MDENEIILRAVGDVVKTAARFSADCDVTIEKRTSGLRILCGAAKQVLSLAEPEEGVR